MKSFLLKCLLACVLGFGLFGYVFQSQIGVFLSDWLSTDAKADVGLSDDELRKARSIEFISPSTTIHKANVSDLRVVSHTADSAVVAFTLSTGVPTNEYPNLHIFLKSGNSVVRTVTLHPADYQHAALLNNEQIRVSIELRAGETGFTAEAIYDGGS